MSIQEQSNGGSGFIVVADHPALDLLNTVARIDGVLVDALKSDRDVLRWLEAAGWPVEADLAKLKPQSLLQTARALRDSIRDLVEKRTAGKRVDAKDLNRFLAESRSYLELDQKKDGSLHLSRIWKHRSAEEILAPLAESAADLLANGDLRLIRRCESEECILWFYDRTKSHHRRWCSMAACGNRHKVAEYRRRRQLTR